MTSPFFVVGYAAPCLAHDIFTKVIKVFLSESMVFMTLRYRLVLLSKERLCPVLALVARRVLSILVCVKRIRCCFMVVVFVLFGGLECSRRKRGTLTGSQPSEIVAILVILVSRFAIRSCDNCLFMEIRFSPAPVECQQSLRLRRTVVAVRMY